MVPLTHRRGKSASIECAKHAALLANSTIWQRDLGPEPSSLGRPRATTDRDRHLDRMHLSPPATPSHAVPIDPIEYENILTTLAYQTA
jgi:hypothetical protein